MGYFQGGQVLKRMVSYKVQSAGGGEGLDDCRSPMILFGGGGLAGLPVAVETDFAEAAAAGSCDAPAGEGVASAMRAL